MNNKNLDLIFKQSGPFSHISSEGLEGIVFRDDKDRYAALVYMAAAANESNTVILAYALMSNHVHFILQGDNPMHFYERFILRMNQYLSRHGHGNKLLPSRPSITPLMDRFQFLDAVAYVVRNQYVVDQTVTPYSELCTSGYLYFNSLFHQVSAMLPYEPVEGLSARKLMQLTFTKDQSIPLSGLKLLNGIPCPHSFVNYKLVEELFGTARLFTIRVFKSVEAQMETALLLGETPFLPDEELSREIWKYCKEKWNVKSVLQLTREQKYELAKHMKYNYHASNGQIVRISSLPQKDVDALFPMSRK